MVCVCVCVTVEAVCYIRYASRVTRLVFCCGHIVLRGMRLSVTLSYLSISLSISIPLTAAHSLPLSSLMLWGATGRKHSLASGCGQGESRGSQDAAGREGRSSRDGQGVGGGKGNRGVASENMGLHDEAVVTGEPSVACVAPVGR